MYFIYTLEYHDGQIRKENGICEASDYTEAIELICNHYGSEDIEEISYLAPITDNSVLILDDIALACIRNNVQNTF